MKRVVFVIATVLALAGCQSAPPINFSVPNVGFSAKKIEAELKSMTVGIARADEKTGELPAGMETLVPQLWQSALQESLNKMAVFNDDAPTKVNLSVKILKLDIPSAGFSMTTETAARYEILDRKTGAIVYTQDIVSKGEVPLDYAFAGITRARESVNRAVQNNITQFLQALETVDVSKPMFPVSQR
ncbi:lipoprotein [Massilia sp. YIM B02443]|uniref:lipoprotein n=1 Tax=Massilia sp. YIM B02443 TaxID=3050127 RepID=UPI0025B69765|nr:lipoprotein [Massilia sp. YIM B02443]MDN4039228.1 UDP-N-acetylglucosamine acyltransferase [Massilia sp. YIM B02443]